MAETGSTRVWMGTVFFTFAWIMTLLAMLMTNSVAVLTDFVNTTLDCLCLAISWYVDRRISSRNRALYAYGTGKIESLVALAVGTVFFCSMIGIGIVIEQRFVHPQQTTGNGIWIVIFFALLFTCTNLIMYIKTRRVYLETGKAHLEAELRIYRVKMCANTGLFVSVIVSSFVNHPIAKLFDPCYAVFLLVMMGGAMIHLFRRNLGVVFDEVVEETVQMTVTRILAKHFDLYEDYCGMRSRRTGDTAFIELALAFDREQSTGETLDRIATIREDLQQELPKADITIICSQPGRSYTL